jgi:hypothetical protein
VRWGRGIYICAFKILQAVWWIGNGLLEKLLAYAESRRRWHLFFFAANQNHEIKDITVSKAIMEITNITVTKKVQTSTITYITIGTRVGDFTDIANITVVTDLWDFKGPRTL